MTRIFRLALLSTALMSLSGTMAAADTLPLKRVVVTASGLALYEHEGQVTGNTTIELPVRLDRVDDMLKSLVVLDAKGQLGGVSLPGKEPLSQTFRGLPFTQDDLTSLVQLLNTLRGAAVQIAGPEAMTGRLMNVAEETEQTKNETTITRHRVSVLTSDGVKTAILEDTTKLQFTDKGVQEQLDRALGAMFTNRIKDQRDLTISLRGEGTRTVGLAYILDAPLWKSSYRLVLPQEGDKDKDAKAVLQGWAVLENTTGQDWKDVSVTLMSGAPVTYHQALYESYFLPRPELPVKVMDRILPHVDEGTVAPVEGEEEQQRKAEGGPGAAGGAVMMNKPMMARARFGTAKGMAAPMGMVASMAAAPAPEPVPAMQAENYVADAAPPMPPESPPMQMAQMTAAAADETASQVTFAFPQPVDLPAGNSLMIPLISHTMPAEKLWVYQPETNAQHPLAAVSMKNDGNTGLPPGILTLYNQTANGLIFIGDADMPLVPKGENRFISFALDTKTKIDRMTQDDRHLGTITIVKGILHQKTVSNNTTTYTIKAPPDEERTIVIEHPRREGWELVKPDGLAAEPDKTSNSYRLRVDVPAGKDKTLKVTLTRADTETIALVQDSPQDLDTRMAAAGKDLPEETRRALEKVKQLQAAVFAPQQEMNNIQQERQTIFSNQERIRQNLQSVSTNTPIGKRYMDQLDKEEDKLNALTKREEEARAKLNEAQKALQDYVADLNL